MALNKNKDLKMFYSISEVAKLFNVSETLLRFWEKEFPTIKPEKAGLSPCERTWHDLTRST